MRYRTYEYRHAESILNANHRLKKETERILDKLELSLPRAGSPLETCGPHHQIQQAFRRHDWQTEVLVSPRTAKRHYFDLYKDRVAIEIELSNRHLLYRDYVHFLLAESDGRIDVGIILLFDEEARTVLPRGLRNGLPRLEDVADDLNSLRSVVSVPIWVVALS